MYNPQDYLSCKRPFLSILLSTIQIFDRVTNSLGVRNAYVSF
jgi:hypothetical protein